MKNWLSKSFFLLIAAAIVTGIVYAFWPQPEVVDIAAVDRGDIQVTVDEDGKTRIREKYIVSAPLSGRLLRIDMDPGDEVFRDETLLATIEPRDPELLDARAIAQAEARVKTAEASRLRAAPILEEARISQANAEAELARSRRAREGNAVTQSQLEDDETAYRRASQVLRAAKHAEEIAEFELEQAEAALLRSRPPIKSEPAESETVEGNGPATSESDEPNGNGWTFAIRAPVSGRVLRVFQESAAVVTPGTSLLELGDPKDLEIEIDVLSSDAVKIETGDLVRLEHWGGDTPLFGRVRLVEPAGFTKISTLGVEEQRVNAIVDLVDSPEARPALGDGFRVEARIIIDEAKDVLRIPASALFREQDQWAAFKVVDGRAVRIKVDVGRSDGIQSEILKGLEAGEQVVVHPSDRILDGTPVQQR
ncbi:MAG: HlyD family efflux transporter periplasmic adaptor subunit [Pirellulales bacterium]